MNELVDEGRRHFLKQLSLTGIALLPATQALAELVELTPGGLSKGLLATSFLIDAAFRLTHYQHLLELEFYFLNVKVVSNFLQPYTTADARYKAYMVVRLPQQHIAEEYVDSLTLQNPNCPKPGHQKSRIAGYSFLCFQVHFDSLPGGLPATAAALMDWNAEYFTFFPETKNQIKPFIFDRSSLRDKPLTDQDAKLHAPDIYPLGFLRPPGQHALRFGRAYYPNERTYPGGLRLLHARDMEAVRNLAPVTALEFPYRLIINPRLPSSEYDSRWIFTSFLSSPTDNQPVELWMATLVLVKKNAPHQSAGQAKVPASSPGGGAAPAPAAGSQEIINQADNQLQLMVLGPAGASEYRIGKITSPANVADVDDRPPPSIGIRTLPNGQDRLDVTRLANLGIAATAPSLTFTPLGVSVQLVLQNREHKRDRISLYQWKQAISFGRDQEVEVANVVIKVPYGLKMLHVRTTRRETHQGRAMLIYREFLQPLEMEKDFASYSKQDAKASYQQPNNKYSTAFQRVRFPDNHPRQILPLADLGNDLCTRMMPSEKKAQMAGQDQQQRAATEALAQRRSTGGCLVPDITDDGERVLAFWAVTPDLRLLEWPLICTGWDGEESIHPYSLYLLKSELYLARNDKKQPLFPYTDDAPALGTLGSGVHDALLSGPDEVAVTQAIQQLELNAVAVATLVQQLRKEPAVKPENLGLIFESLWKVNSIDGTRDWGIIKLALTRLGVPTTITSGLDKLLDSPNTWQRIRHQMEEGSLHALDVMRGSFDQQLQWANDQLVALSTRGQRDVEDLVMEEWSRFKRRLLTLENSWEGELRRLHRLAAGLLHEADQYRVQTGATVAGGTQVALATLVGAIQTRIKSLMKSLDGNQGFDLKALQRTQLPPTSLLIAVVADVRQSYTDFFTALVGVDSAILGTKQQVLAELRQRQTLLPQVPKELELGPAFEHALFVCRLPEKLWPEVQQPGVKSALMRIRLLASGIHHLETSLKSCVDAGQAKICYAVHQAEDEMEVLKKALDDKWKKQKGYAEDMVRKSREWVADYARFSRDFGKAASGHLATMRTKYLIVRGNLRLIEEQIEGQVNQVVHRVLDVSDPYACYPCLHTLVGCPDALSDLIRRDVWLKIKHAPVYIEHQLDNYSLEVQNNATRVVAEVHQEAREMLQGALREASKDLGGLINLEAGSHYLTLLKDKSQKAQATLDAMREQSREVVQQIEATKNEALKTVNYELNQLLNNYQSSAAAAQQEFYKLGQPIRSLTQEAYQKLQVAAQDLQVVPEAFMKGLETKILGSIRLRDLLGSNFDLPKMQRLPDKVTYQLLARDFKPFDAKVFRFVPSAQTALTTYLEVPTRSPENFRSETRLSNFTLSIFDDRLLVEFRHIELVSNRHQRNKARVQLGTIGFGKELEFLAALTQGFAIPGTGLQVVPAADRVTITYALPIPGVSGGAFTFDNLKVNAGVTIPLPTGLGATARPVGLRFGLNSPTDQFALGVLIFGGKGHFQLEATPKYLSLVDIGLSFGGLFRINLVIASGEAFLQAGIRYVYSREETGEAYMELYGILSCGANVTVFGFIDISIVFKLFLKYRKDSAGAALYGVASVACSVRIGFFSKSFTLTFSQRIAGAPAGPPPSEPQRLPQQQAPQAPVPPTLPTSGLSSPVPVPSPPAGAPPTPPVSLPQGPVPQIVTCPPLELPVPDSTAYQRADRLLNKLVRRQQRQAVVLGRRQKRWSRRTARLDQRRYVLANDRVRADHDMHMHQDQERVLQQLLSQFDSYALSLP